MPLLFKLFASVALSRCYAYAIPTQTPLHSLVTGHVRRIRSTLLMLYACAERYHAVYTLTV